jgi:hypothetical protein
MSGSLSRIAGAKMTGGGSNIRDGKYKLLVENCKLQKGYEGECFIAELRVIEAVPNGEMQIASDEKTTTDKPVVPNAVGSTCSLICNLTKHDSAPSNIKKFVYGVLSGLGYAEEQITEEVLGEVIGGQQPLRGMAVECETYRSVNKGKKTAANAGKLLVLSNWKGIPQDAAGIKTQRAYLDNNKATVETAPASTSTAPAGGLMGMLK